MKTFKTIMAVAMVAATAMSFEPAFAQDYSPKEQKQMARTMKKQQDELYKRSPKMARKTAKEWEKENYNTNPYYPEQKVYPTKKDEMVRSKSEVMLADMYCEM